MNIRLICASAAAALGLTVSSSSFARVVVAYAPAAVVYVPPRPVYYAPPVVVAAPPRPVPVVVPVYSTVWVRPAGVVYAQPVVVVPR
ncbi:hypothetical protein [Paraburkholderia sp.]|uniref:hypothetical protein n=1 Tax=Paraburkholderia sp. TaxID=1926495 RepID=UPI00238EAB12|nr:hypothetical protein [Paraburkholderia sp.]MDE1182482.1 hypothetical protein [Paraburkholderia sp.]